MLSNINITSQKLVDTVANNTILEFYAEVETLGLDNDAIHAKVSQFIDSPEYYKRINQKVSELVDKFKKDKLH